LICPANIKKLLLAA